MTLPPIKSDAPLKILVRLVTEEIQYLVHHLATLNLVTMERSTKGLCQGLGSGPRERKSIRYRVDLAIYTLHYTPTLVDGKLGAENGYLGRRFWRPFYRRLSHRSAT